MRTTSNHPARVSIAIVQRILALYRLPILVRLSQQPDLAVTCVSAKEDSRYNIKTIPPTEDNAFPETSFLRRIYVTNCHFGVFCWQHGLIFAKTILSADILVFEGSVHFISTWMSAVVAKLRGQKVVMWTHGYLRDERGLKNSLRIAFYSLADAHILYSDRGKQLMIARGFNERRLYVVYNSLNYNKHTELFTLFHAKVAEQESTNAFPKHKKVRLVFIGRLVETKKLYLLISAMSVLNASGAFCELCVIGDGPERPKLEALARELSVSGQIVFCGECYDEIRSGQLLFQSDICVSPGEVGLTAIHSLSYGTPVITHDNPDFQGPEHEAIQHGYTGMFFKSNCVQSLASAILEWLVNNPDREIVRTRCRQVIDSRYNPNYQVQVFRNVVVDLMAEKGRVAS